MHTKRYPPGTSTRRKWHPGDAKDARRRRCAGPLFGRSLLTEWSSAAHLTAQLSVARRCPSAFNLCAAGPDGDAEGDRQTHRGVGGTALPSEPVGSPAEGRRNQRGPLHLVSMATAMSIYSSNFEQSEPSKRCYCRSHLAHFLTRRHPPVARSEASVVVLRRARWGRLGGRATCSLRRRSPSPAARHADVVDASPLDQLRNGLAEVDAAALTPTAQPLGKRCVCGGALTVPEPPTPPDLDRCVTAHHRRRPSSPTHLHRPPSRPIRAGPGGSELVPHSPRDGLPMIPGMAPRPQEAAPRWSPTARDSGPLACRNGGPGASSVTPRRHAGGHDDHRHRTPLELLGELIDAGTDGKYLGDDRQQSARELHGRHLARPFVMAVALAWHGTEARRMANAPPCRPPPTGAVTGMG